MNKTHREFARVEVYKTVRLSRMQKIKHTISSLAVKLRQIKLINKALRACAQAFVLKPVQPSQMQRLKRR